MISLNFINPLMPALRRVGAAGIFCASCHTLRGFPPFPCGHALAAITRLQPARFLLSSSLLLLYLFCSALSCGAALRAISR